MNWFKRKKTAREVVDDEREKSISELKTLTLSSWCKERVAVLEATPVHEDDKWKGNQYAERLIKEWLDYKKIVLAIDFDDTLAPWGFKCVEANELLLKTMRVVKLAQEVGCHTSIWSACAPDRYEEIRRYCESHGIVVDSINENPIPLPYGNHRKMYYNHLLDDRAGLQQAVAILEYAAYRVRSDRKPQTENFDC